jgi:hypothetical protein
MLDAQGAQAATANHLDDVTQHHKTLQPYFHRLSRGGGEGHADEVRDSGNDELS